MTSSSVSFEVRGENRRWLREVQKYAIPCPGVDDWQYWIFELSKAKQRKHLVAPFLEDFWFHRKRFISLLNSLRVKKVFTASFLNCRDKFFSSGINEHGLRLILAHNTDSCVLLPRDESFLILSTQDDYWLASGPRPIVESIAGMRLEMTFARLRETVKNRNPFDADDEFLSIMLPMYEKHNSVVEKGP